MKPPSCPAENDLAEAAAIVDAVRQVHEDPELRAEARSDLPSVLDRLHLTGTARQAVAAALTIILTGPMSLDLPFSFPLPRGNIFWQ